MNDIIDVRVRGEDGIQRRLVGDVAGVVVRFLAADQLDAAQHFLRRVVEVVDDDHFVVCFEEGEGGEGADVACAAGRRLAIEGCGCR